jgi:hypothetical protein
MASASSIAEARSCVGRALARLLCRRRAIRAEVARLPAARCRASTAMPRNGNEPDAGATRSPAAQSPGSCRSAKRCSAADAELTRSLHRGCPSVAAVSRSPARLFTCHFLAALPHGLTVAAEGEASRDEVVRASSASSSGKGASSEYRSRRQVIDLASRVIGSPEASPGQTAEALRLRAIARADKGLFSTAVTDAEDALVLEPYATRTVSASHLRKLNAHWKLIPDRTPLIGS